MSKISAKVCCTIDGDNIIELHTLKATKESMAVKESQKLVDILSKTGNKYTLVNIIIE